MSNNSFRIHFVSNDNEELKGQTGSLIKFTSCDIHALAFAHVFSAEIADCFVNYCNMSFTSGDTPSCFARDMSAEDIIDLRTDLTRFQHGFPEALGKSILCLRALSK